MERGERKEKGERGKTRGGRGQEKGKSINEKEERAKYGALWYAEHDWEMIRLLGKKLSILGSISKIAA